MADGREDERAPLLVNQQPIDTTTTTQAESTGDPPPKYTPYAGSGQEVVPVIGVDELPPPYTPSGVPTVNCKVCHAPIDITGKLQQHVVKCNNCNEATPIKAAPPGKKYVRCPCNCLLICREQSLRIACPRQNCKRIISLGGVVPVVSIRSPGTKRVICCHCGETFLFSFQNSALARCPHCRRVSSVGRQYAHKRAWIFLIIGLVFLAAGIGVTVGTYEDAAMHGGIYAVWTGLFLLAVALFGRGIYYCCMRVSSVHGSIS